MKLLPLPILFVCVFKNGLCLPPLLQRQDGFVSFESHKRILYHRVSRKEPQEGTSHDGEHQSEATKGASRDGEHPSEVTKGTSRDGEHPSEATKGTSRDGEHPSEATKGTSHDGEHPSEATKGTSRDGEHQSEATKGTFHNGKYQSEATEENLHKKYSNDSPCQRLRNEKLIVQLNKDPDERRIRNQKNRYIQIG